MDADERLKNAKRCREIIEKFIDHLNVPQTVIISGGARGVDSVAAQVARERDIRVIEIKPDWDRFGKSAGFRRNTQIVQACDDLIAFWNMESRGTLDSLKKARKYHRPFGIVGPNGLLVSMMDEDILDQLRPKRKKMSIPKPRGKRGRRK